MTAQATLAVHVREADFQEQVVQLATLLGWHSWHDTDARRNHAGFPDLILVRDRVLFCELKTQRGRLTGAQRVFLARLADAGAEVHVWRPGDWPAIHATLTRTSRKDPAA